MTIVEPISKLFQIISEKLYNDPDVTQSDLVDHVGAAILNNAELKYALDSDQRIQQVIRDGAKGFQTLVKGGTTYIDGTHIHVSDPDKLEDALETVLVKLLTPETKEIDFKPYLRSIIDDKDYQEWQGLYTPTTAESQKNSNNGEPTNSRISKYSSRLKLMVETVSQSQKEQFGQPKPEEQRKQVEQLDVLEGLRKYADDHVLLIGRPGSGKTTSLERLLWQEADNVYKRQGGRIPVLMRLRRCTSTFEKLIQDFLSSHQLYLNSANIEHLLSTGKLLLILDGLNELPEFFRPEIANFRDRYRYSTPMIVSTRDLSIGGDLGIKKVLKMMPLTETQMKSFINRYLGEEGDKLFQQLREDRLRKLAEAPLLLLMLCRVFHQKKHLPANLGLAFREFTQLYDKKIQEDVPTDYRDQWHRLLRNLSFAMMHGKTPTEFRLSISREEVENLFTAYSQNEGGTNPRDFAERWLKDLLKYNLIQLVVKPNYEEHIEFRHQLIQEYYAAEYLLRVLPTLSDEELKRDYLNYIKWTEPLALMLAFIDNEVQAQRVVKLSMYNVDLLLGARLSGEVKQELQSKTVGWLVDLKVSQHLIIKCLKVSCSQAAIPGLLNALMDDEYYVHASAEIVMGEIGGKAAIPGLLDILKDEYEKKYVRGRAASALGKIGDKAATPGLLDILKDEYEKKYVRGRAASALGKIGDIAAIPGLLDALKDEDRDISESAASALVEIGDKATTPGLLDALKDKDGDVRGWAASALGKIGDKAAVPGLLDMLKDESWDVRGRAASALGKIGDKAAIPGLLDMLKDESWDVRGRAASALGKIGDKAAIPGLLDMLKDESWDVRGRAASALGKIGDKAAVPGLLDMLKDESWDVRGWTASALGKIGDKAAVPGLLDMLKDEYSNKYVCESAVLALGKIGDKAAIPGLLDALWDQDFDLCKGVSIALGKIGGGASIPGLLDGLLDILKDEYKSKYVYKSAVLALVKIGDKAATPGLLDALKNTSKYVRGWAALALGEMGDKAAIPGLLDTLKDKDTSMYVRGRAALALAKIGDIAAIPGLLDALKDEDRDVSESAASALVEIGDKATTPGLLDALKDKDGDVRGWAASALGKIGDKSAIPGLLDALKDESWDVRKSAASALGKIGDKSAIPGLLDALRDESWDIRKSVVSALGKIGDKAAIPGLLKILKGWNTDARVMAVYALGKIDGKAAIIGLLDALKYKRKKVRLSAALELARLGNKEAAPILRKALKDKDSYIRRDSMEMLGILGDPISLTNLWQMLVKNQSSDYSESQYLWESITAIQNHCGFYNYELWQDVIEMKSLIKE